jgi:hypothetical protein
MRWYEDINYGGAMLSLYGSYGTCDSAGYRFVPSEWWKYHMSSITGNGACDTALLATGGTTFVTALPRGSFPPTVNDWVMSVRVYA